MTGLGAQCFGGCTYLTSVEIPSTVTNLGEFCFSNCSSLTTIVIPSTVTNLGKYCFDACSSLKTVTCEMPVAIVGDFFSDTPIDLATLYVPAASLDSYKKAYPWRGFGTILPIASTGMDTTTVKPATIDAIYNLDGKRSNGTSRGLNIMRMSDGTTRKVMK